MTGSSGSPYTTATSPRLTTARMRERPAASIWASSRRDYFENPDASAPVDLVAESESFSAWAAAVADVDVPAEELRAFMAVEAVEEPDDTFVEDTVVRLLGRLNIPLPEWLAD